MKFFFHWFDTNRYLLKQILKISQDKNAKLYLVGGVLRDILLEKEKANPDLDFCLKKGAINFARSAARELKSGFVVLDEAHGCARVVKKTNKAVYTLDFSDFRGRTIEEDLAHRDFTINSMALGLEELFGKDFFESLIDPYGARPDLKKRIIRAVNKDAFDEDPLRILRAYSLGSVFDFKIDQKTLKLACLKKNKLKTVSKERIRDELFKILSSDNSYEFLKKLDDDLILELILPQIKPMKNFKKRALDIDIWGHSLLTLKNIEAIVKRNKNKPELKYYLAQEISLGRNRLSLIKLACILHDAGKPQTFGFKKGKVSFHGHERWGASIINDIAEGLKLSNEETRILRKIALLHLRPGFMVTTSVLTPRAKFRFFRDAQDEAVSILLLALADERSTKGYLLLEKIRERYERAIPSLIKTFFSKRKEIVPARLLNGNDLMSRLDLRPSPLIGKLLAHLEELQAIGKIKTKEEGLRAASLAIKSSYKSGK